MRRYLRVGLSFVIGAVLGVLAHYVLYRMTLPVEPFIYTAF
jgi:hypothetical protein